MFSIVLQDTARFVCTKSEKKTNSREHNLLCRFHLIITRKIDSVSVLKIIYIYIIHKNKALLQFHDTPYPHTRPREVSIILSDWLE